MNERVKEALNNSQVIDITTTGRKTGQPRRIEISFTNLDGQLFIWGGVPGPRDWLANLQANPDFTFHLKESISADLPARARCITAVAERRDIFARLIDATNSTADLEALINGSPLVEVTIRSQ